MNKRSEIGIHSAVESAGEQLRILRTYPAAGAIILGSVFCVLYCGHLTHRIAHAIIYLVTLWLCAFVTEIIVDFSPYPAISFPIHRSAIQEAVVISVCTLLGQILLYVRFGSSWDTIQGPARLALIVLIVFSYPIVLAIIYLFFYHYQLNELGINLRFWYLPVIVHLIWGSIALSTAADTVIWHRFLQENGIFGALFTGLFCAALAEEFTRMLLQTRLGMLFHNTEMGLVIATLIWVGIHIPRSYPHTQSGAVPLLFFMKLATLIPLGLLWGYMTNRTKSLLPAVLVHGLNFWGLQNSF